MVLKVENLCKSFGAKKVLDNVGFSAESGRAVGLLGRNGAGKTTTIRIVMGVFGGDAGSITVDGAPIDRSKLNIGYLPEERGLYPKKLILEQLVYFGMLRGMKRADAAASAKRWVTRLGMDEHLLKRLDTLSKGNQQKIQLAQSLLTDPEIVILDEPFSGLDPVNAMLLKDVVMELIKGGKVVLFSSHQMSYVEEFCDDIAIINHGKIVLSGGIREIKRGYDRNRLVISSREPEAVEKLCAAPLAALTEKTERRGADVMVTLKNAADKHAFIAGLANGEADLDGIAVYEPTLNDIFVQYTGDSADKSAAAKSTEEVTDK